MDVISGLTDIIWQVGVVFSAIFAFLGHAGKMKKNNPVDPTILDAVVSVSFGWLFYGIPFMLLGIATILAIRAINSYRSKTDLKTPQTD